MKIIIIALLVITNVLFASDELVEIGHYSIPNTEIGGVHIWHNFAYLRTRYQILKINIENPQIPSLAGSFGYSGMLIYRGGFYENYAIVASDSILVKINLETMTVSDSINFDYKIGACRFVINDSFLVVPTATDSGVHIYNIKHPLTTTPTYNYKNKEINPVYAIFKNGYFAYTRSWYYGIAQYYNNEFSNGEVKYFSDPRPSQTHSIAAYSDYYLTNDYKNGGSESSNILMLKQVYYNTDRGERECYLNQMGTGSSLYSTVEYKNKIIATTDSSLFVIAINANNHLEVVSKYPAPSSRLASNDKYLFAGRNGLQILAFDNTNKVGEPIEELIINNGIIKSNQKDCEVWIFDINGAEIKHLLNVSYLDVNNLQHGVYFIKINKNIYKINI